MYNTILVPLDGSTRAEEILPHMEGLALGLKSTVIFLQVVEPSAALVSPYDMVPYYDPAIAESWVSDAQNYLDALVGKCAEKGIAARAFVEQGPIVRVLLAVAERENADLIAMASHGRTGLARVFMGSVAAGVLHQTHRPLLLIHSHGSHDSHGSHHS